MLLTALMLGLVLPVASSFGGPTAVAYAALWIVVFAATQLANGYGFDGGSMWTLLVVPGSVRADVRGRQLAWLMLVGPVVVEARGPEILAEVRTPAA